MDVGLALRVRGRGRACHHFRVHAVPPDDDDPPPEAPTPPDADACCGSGCERCVFDVFEDARERYLESLREWQERQAGRTPG
jgi:hypothetical protein